MGVTTLDQTFSEDFPVWDKIGAVVRLSYGIGIYGGMVLAGRFICSITGIDCMGGFHPSLDAILEGLGYAAPPIMALLFILDDEVVKLSPHARAIRDVEDEELRSFFYGMSPWQVNNILAPIITHGIYSAVILGHGLWKIHDHRRRLRQRIQQLKSEGKNSTKL
ncbi:hypothetical protein E1A91_A08G174400v1 [Gossypium mustelinum]|uniref:Uncharacterized protein n=1 Tax=Gossypium mustelinum TaxID=34275 RepID=A0A5D2YAN2_GOSMU|nr:hypothetical protein E1A91_A08G174400v1 [Gossypium mustelinum]